MLLQEKHGQEARAKCQEIQWRGIPGQGGKRHGQPARAAGGSEL